MGDEFLDHLAKRLEDAVVIDAGLMVADGRVSIAVVVEFVFDTLTDVLINVRFLFVVQTVNLVLQVGD